MMENSYSWDESLDSGRVHINLSKECWLIIRQDEENFWFKDKKVTDSGFLNIVIANFYQQADASYYERAIEKEDKLDELFPEQENPSNDLNIEQANLGRQQLKAEIIDKYILDLQNKAASYPKGVSFKLKLNKENTQILTSLPYIKFLGKYLKSLFEEYSRLPSHIREQIIYKDILDTVTLADANDKQVKITTLKRSKVNDENIIIERKFLFNFYKIMQDPSRLFNYLVGYSQEVLQGNELGEKHITSLRLSRIRKADIILSRNAFISKEGQKEIDTAINNLGVQFLIGDLENIKVKFTKKGLELFKKQLYLRPNYYDIIAKDTYVFHCTSMQAMSYFFKLGKNIEILEPLELREQFMQRYESALNVYKK